MERARDTGQAVLSGKVTLIVDGDKGHSTGFLIYVPVYQKGLPTNTVEERRIALYGYVFSAFSARNFLNAIFPEGLIFTHLQIFDGRETTPEALLFDSQGQTGIPHLALNDIEKETVVELAGHAWTLRLSPTPAFQSGVDRSLPWTILGGGIFLSISFCLLIWSQQRTRDTALQLRRSEAHLFATLHSIGDAVISTDALGCVTALNPVAERLTGWRLSEARERPIAEIFHIINEETRQPAAIPIDAVLATGEIRGLANHTALIARDGTQYLIDDSAAPIRDIHGRLTGVVMVFRDVTDQRRAQQEILSLNESLEQRVRERTEALAHAKKDWEKTYDAVPDMIAILGTDYRIIRGNRALADRLGLHPRDLVGKFCYEYIHGTSEPHPACPHRQMLADGQPHATEMQEPHIGGVLDVSVTPLRDDSGALICSVHSIRDITNRKKTEEKLLENERLYRSLVELSPDLIGIHCEGKWVFMNDTGARLLGGSSPADFIGKPILDIIHPDFRQTVINRICRIADAGQKSQTLEQKLIRLDGTVIEVEGAGVPIIFKGKPAIQVVIRDISERKRIEDEKNAVTDRLLKVAIHIPGLIYQFRIRPDGTSHFPFASHGINKIYGVSPDDVVEDASAVFDAVHPEDRERVAKKIAESAEKLTVWHDEYRTILPTGQSIWVEGIATPEKLKDNSILWHGYIKDISDRKLADEKLRKSEQRLAYLFSVNPTVAYTLDVSFAPTWVSSNIISLMGYRSEEVLTPNWWRDNLHADDRKQAISKSASVLAKGRVTQEYRFLKKNGDVIWVHDELRLLCDKCGNPTELIGAWTNISERKKAEQDRIFRIVAEQASEAKSAFVANMSHEIRTPLNAILGFAQILVQDPTLTDRQAEQMQTIIRSGQHLLSLVNDILQLSRIEAGRSQLNMTNCRLDHLLDDIDMMFRSQVEEKGLQLIVERKKSVSWSINVDNGKLRQVIINLMSNALKFTKTGKIWLRVKVDTATEDVIQNQGGMRLQVDVEDTGPGIVDAELDSIFDAFAQSEAGIKAGGTGLGLTISKRLIELMGGTITVKSSLSKGTCFCFQVPVARADIMVETPIKEKMRSILHLAPGTGPFHILVVDDHKDNRDLLRAILQPLGFEIAEAVNGQEAIDFLEKFSPHAILMDLRMPVMNGYEATIWIKASEKNRTIPIIAVTASAFEDDEKAILATGVDGYIRRPVDRGELLEMLEKLIGLRYEYTAEETSDTRGAPSRSLTSEDLALLPVELVQSMQQAVEAGEMVKLKMLIAQVEKMNSAVARGLLILSNNYDYEKLKKILKR
ncbi:MAG: PAS domain S-box protein [Desulfobacterales bacterium]|nr:PAS domain S-box protein [Desulfobacterales bacterium]